MAHYLDMLDEERKDANMMKRKLMEFMSTDIRTIPFFEQHKLLKDYITKNPNSSMETLIVIYLRDKGRELAKLTHGETKTLYDQYVV